MISHSSESASPLILTREIAEGLLPMRDCVGAVEVLFRALADERTEATGVPGRRVELGSFHIKTAGLKCDQHLFAAKINANFAGNPARHGLPTIQGVLALFDADRGVLLALTDSTIITSRLTAAATAVAAKFLASVDAGTLALVGCGEQGRSQLRALALVRTLRRATAVDIDGELARRFAAEMSAELGIPITVGTDARAAARQSDIVVTCMPSKRATLGPDDIAPGAFLAAVGADSETKQELEPALMALLH